MYDNNILTLYIFFCAVLKYFLPLWIGAEVSDLMILMVGSRKRFRFPFIFPAIFRSQATLRKVYFTWHLSKFLRQPFCCCFYLIFHDNASTWRTNKVDECKFWAFDFKPKFWFIFLKSFARFSSHFCSSWRQFYSSIWCSKPSNFKNFQSRHRKT
jgi:hypothetical protein